MQILTLRPTFDLRVECPRAEFFQAVRQNLNSSDWNWESHAFDNYIELHVTKEELRFWSPHLSLFFEDRDGATGVLGRFAPRQEVWTLVWGAYLACAFGAFFAWIYAFAAWFTKTPTMAGYMALLLLVGIGAIYWISYIGQSWSRDQMERLRLECNELFRRSLAPAKSSIS